MNKIQVLWGSVLSFGLFAGAVAAPSNPQPRTVDNDGDSVTLQTLGDEHYRFTRTVDGYLIEADENGVYYYADANGERSNIKAKNAGARSAADKAFLRTLDKGKVLDAHQKKHPDRLKRKERYKRPDWVPTATSDESGADAGSENGVPPVRPLPNAKVHTKGDIKFPVILVAGSGSQASTDSASLYKALNQDNYTSNGHTGSVRDYFNDQSSGAFKPSYDLFYVTVSGALSSYVGSEDKLVKEAISAMRSKYSNFDASKYDSNNDGIVDAAGFLYAGAVTSGGNELGGFQYELGWNSVGQQDAGNGKKFNSYFIISDQSYFPVFVHEFSHTMGLMDHYCVRASDCYDDFSSSSYQSPGAHYWDVMATGMYANNGLTPPSYSGFERAFMGWMSYTDLTASSAVTSITPLNTTNVAYKISVSGDSDEWWVLENRQKTKWDAALPNHGMLIWHIDYDQEAWDGDALNDDKTHQRIDVVEAGNLRVTDYYDGFSTTHFMDDPFPGSQNVTSYGPFTSWAGKSQNIQLYSITEKNNNVCFATQSGVSVGDCSTNVAASSSSAVVASSSSAKSSSSSAVRSSSSAARSSSSVAASSSSAKSSSSVIPGTDQESQCSEMADQVRHDECVSSSSVVPASSSTVVPSSSASVVVGSQTVYISAQLPISDSYVPVTVSLSDVASALGISAGNAASLYNSGSLTYSAVAPSGALDGTASTAEAPGHWFDANGNVITWGEGAALYSNLDLNNMNTAVGNYPNGVTVGSVYTIAQALTYNNVQVIFKISVTVVDGSANVVASSSSVVAVSSSSVIPGSDQYSSASTSVDCTSYPLCGESQCSEMADQVRHDECVSSSSVIPSSSAGAVIGSSNSVVPGVSSSSESVVAGSSASVIPGSSSNVLPGVVGESQCADMSALTNGVPSACATTTLLSGRISAAQLRLENRTLHVTASEGARKTISVFDMLGNRLMVANFVGTQYSLDLAAYAGKVLVVRLSEGGRTLKQMRISVK